nr:tetratricopeptide repeat protein [Bacteroidales bacterium]
MKKILLIIPALLLIMQISCTQTAEEYVDRGNTKYELKDYRGAIADYNKAIEINPENADAYFNRGFTKHDLEDYRGA